jgi:sodium/proline symporter
LFALFSRKTTWKAALSGILAGTVTLVLWKQLGMGAYMYEIVPGFLMNVITILIVNSFVKQEDVEIDKEFDEIREIVTQK